MLITDVCQFCNLTKKAIEYYERQGLIKPQILENGYRDYNENTLNRLKEIAVLRHCGLNIGHIQTILDASDRRAALARCRYLAEIKRHQMEAQQACMDRLILEYDINSAFKETEQKGNEIYTIHEKLVMAFPGSYGIWLSLHFGRFLNTPIKTEEQKSAYKEIIAYLDKVSTEIPEELAGYLEEAFKSIPPDAIEALETATQNTLNTAIKDPEAYFENNDYNKYLKYRLSDEFRESQAGRMVSLMAEFQNVCGYKDVFIANMKKLSSSYCSYFSNLEAADAKLLQKYPQAKRMYPKFE